jgi:flagellar motility protein MotE (MotC chaperone)
MCYGDYSSRGFQRARSFLTKEERVALLKEYKQDLEKESQGVAERIKELEAAA